MSKKTPEFGGKPLEKETKKAFQKEALSIVYEEMLKLPVVSITIKYIYR